MAPMNTLAQKYQALLAQAEAHQHPDTEALRLCFQLLSLANQIDLDCAQRLAPHALSEGRFVVLFLLAAAPQGLSPHAIATQAGITRATVTGLLDGLEKEGLLQRLPSAHDRRSLIIELTPKGQSLSQQVFTEHTHWMGHLFQPLNPTERQQLHALLHKVSASLGQRTP